MARLGDIITQVRGVSYKPEDVCNDASENSIGLLRANNIKDGHIILDDIVYVNTKCVSNAQRLRAGDILVCTSSGSKDLVGKAAYVDSDLSMAFGAFCKVVRPNNAYPKYIGHFFNSPQYRKKISDAAAGANINNIRNEHIDCLEIPLPPLDEQRRIAAVLDKAATLIDLRKQQLAKLDELVKARFVEMFGDAVHNDRGWQTDTVDNICKDIYGGGTPSKAHPEYYENGTIPWVSSKDMKTDILTESQIYINQAGIDNSTAKLVPINSVVMVIRSGVLKHTLPVAINAVPITVNQDLKVFIPNEKMLSRFLAVQFKMHERDILTGVRAVTADNIEFNSLKQRPIIVPPIELQQEYASFLEQIDKSKAAVQKALDEAQLLFDSLMQKYFG